MTSRLRGRLPIFEAALLVVVVATGWAAMRLHTTVNELDRPAGQQLATLDAQMIQEILKLQLLFDVKDRYADLADRLEGGVAELRDALQEFVRGKDRAEIARFLRTRQALELWLKKQRDSIDARKLGSLRDWLSSTGESKEVALDLDILVQRSVETYSNYLAAIKLTEGQALTPDLVQQKLDQTMNLDRELLDAAGKARRQAAAVAAYLERRPAEITREARAIGGEDRLTLSVNNARRSLQLLFLMLIALLIAQCVLLMVAFYGRFVVAPLRQKMAEDNTAIEHQRKLDHFARLATGLAHEIRNPLTAISVRLFTLQKGMSKGSGEPGDAALIRAEIDRLEQILKSFLRLARPTEPKFAVVTADHALREVRDLLAPQLQRQAIDLKLDTFASMCFHADPLQLKQVLINLVQNAADAIGRRGAITLRARQDEIRLIDRPVESVILEVEDTGGGITPEVQERLFDPFFSTKEYGTGLGLPIAAKIIDQHNGILDFETRMGRGTTFRVILPMTSP
jgi:signal transduction histidine kinase